MRSKSLRMLVERANRVNEVSLPWRKKGPKGPKGEPKPIGQMTDAELDDYVDNPFNDDPHGWVTKHRSERRGAARDVPSEFQEFYNDLQTAGYDVEEMRKNENYITFSFAKGEEGTDDYIWGEMHASYWDKGTPNKAKYSVESYFDLPYTGEIVVGTNKSNTPHGAFQQFTQILDQMASILQAKAANLT